MIPFMESFASLLTDHLRRIGWGPYGLVKRLKEMPAGQRLSEQYVYALCRGDKLPAGDKTLQKLAAVPGIELSYERLKAWRAVGEYTEEGLVELIRATFPERKQREKFAKKITKE